MTSHCQEKPVHPPKTRETFLPQLFSTEGPFCRRLSCHRQGSQNTCPSTFLSLKGCRVSRSYSKEITCDSGHSRWSKEYSSSRWWLEDQQTQEKGAGKVQVEAGIFWEVGESNALSRKFSQHYRVISEEAHTAWPLAL